jgi:hypothetical protein
MFLIAIPQTDIPSLNGDGCNVKINGQQTLLRREGDYLRYGENRCKILEEVVSGENVQFCAASHGAEEEPHEIMWPEVRGSEDTFPVLTKAEDTNAMTQRAFEEFAQQHDLDDQERLDLLDWMVGDCVADVEGVLLNALPHTPEQLPEALAEVWERENGPENEQHYRKRK